MNCSCCIIKLQSVSQTVCNLRTAHLYGLKLIISVMFNILYIQITKSEISHVYMYNVYAYTCTCLKTGGELRQGIAQNACILQCVIFCKFFHKLYLHSSRQQIIELNLNQIMFYISYSSQG